MKNRIELTIEHKDHYTVELTNGNGDTFTYNPQKYEGLEDFLNGAKILTITCVSKSLPDHYSGELNNKRIKAYRLLHEQYNLEEGTVRDIFCKGADWYKEQCQKGNVC